MTTKGKFVFTLILLLVVFFGAARWWSKLKPSKDRPTTTTTQSAAGKSGDESADASSSGASLTEPQTEVPSLTPPAASTPKDDVVEIELREYAGYAGLIVANGGLEPNPNSVFAQKHGFKLKITLSEEESWSALNSGKMAASATTVDVLAVYGKQFQVVVPAQIGFSRGADGIVVRSDIKRINGLKGRILAPAQFNEADFF